jgi:hypothetical protein
VRTVIYRAFCIPFIYLLFLGGMQFIDARRVDFVGAKISRMHACLPIYTIKLPYTSLCPTLQLPCQHCQRGTLCVPFAKHVFIAPGQRYVKLVIRPEDVQLESDSRPNPATQSWFKVVIWQIHLAHNFTVDQKRCECAVVVGKDCMC